ncbi:MAG: copper ion binding protein [Prevotella sp.]|nr:copper ion binding protein [Prevotella sp.]
MNKKTLLLITLLAGITASLHAMTVDTLTVRIKGMKCEECAHKVMTAVRQLPGIDNVKSNIERRTTTVTFDPALTCRDSIEARLAATGRFKASPYSPDEVIRRGFGLRIDDMHCQNCANRITKRLSQIEAIDSMSPHLDKHYIFIRYDANRTCKADIRAAIGQLGYTPVNYYSGPKVSYAYYNIPAEQATQETVDEVIIITGVEDVNVNQQKQSLAVTFFTDETNADQLLADIRQAGIKAELPPAHECKE